MFGVAVQLTLPLFLASFFPLHPSIQLAPIAIAKGIGMGLITAVTFALWPLIEIQHVRPYVIFRRDVSTSATPPITTFRSAFQLRWAPGCVVLLAVVGLTYSHTHSLALGSMFLGFVFAALTLLSLTAWLVTRVTSRLPKFRSLAWRQGLANLSRPGSQTLPIIVSIGLGVMVIMAISLIERDMVTHIGAYRPDTIPSFFFIDIQPDQKHTFLSEISSYIDKGNQYKERNQLIAAVSAYLKSIALIPTPEAYDRLKKVLENINMKLNEEHADIYQTIKQNLQENLKGCRQQIEKFP